MKAQRTQLRCLVAAGLSLWAAAAFPQTFSSGSTGVDGDWNPTCTPTPCTVSVTMPPSGVFNYGTVNVPAGVTVVYTKNAANTPVTILATGDVSIDGTIKLDGGNGSGQTSAPASSGPGGVGGPGGFNGGTGEVGGVFPAASGMGPGGGTGAQDGNGLGASASYGAPGSFLALQPLFGGSGGGGGLAVFGAGTAGASGGGGGGAILIASSGKITVTSTGRITANGGNTPFSFSFGFGGHGSGGAIRLVAREVASSGFLQAKNIANYGTPAGVGRIRVEAILPISLTGTIDPGASLSQAPGPVSAGGNPALINLPTISIGTVGAIVPNSPPKGTFAEADAVLPVGTTNPVTVAISLTNTPVGGATSITLKIAPQSVAATTVTVPTSSHTGTFAASSATTSVTFPSGSLTILQAWATFTITSTIAGLMPSIDGEQVERVMVADDSTLHLVTKSGKEKRVDQLAREDQIRVALAWETLKGTR